MAESQQGPAQGVLSAGRRVLNGLLAMVETRLQLLSLELEEGKAHLLQLLLLLGLTLLLTAFGLFCLIALIFLAVDEAHRLLALGLTTGGLLLAALVVGWITLAKARRAPLLSATRSQLQEDRRWLEQQL